MRTGKPDECPGRPLGANVIAVAELVEGLGRVPGSAVAQAANKPLGGINKYLRRAAAYGIVKSFDTQPPEYQAVADWRKLLERKVAVVQRKETPSIRPVVSFVFDLGRN